jgi:hypothetical protein
MATGEESHGGVSKAEVRTQEIVEHVGEAAARRVKEFLREYVGEGKPLSEEGLAEIVAAEREKAAAVYRMQREAGLANDEVSQTPGLTALLKLQPHSNGRDRRVFDLVPIQPEFSSPSIEEVKELDENTRLFALSLPEGVYHVDNFMYFYTKGRVFAGEVRGERDDSFALYPHQVVRVEGEGGELWQNPDYNPDGTKREAAEVIN